MKEVNCFGLPKDKYKLMPDKKITLSTVYPARLEDFKQYSTVLIYNEKLKTWEAHGYVEYTDKCPVCGTPILVRAIAGTTWLACCSEECYARWRLEKTLDGEKS
jgi:hypothetical protein